MSGLSFSTQAFCEWDASHVCGTLDVNVLTQLFFFDRVTGFFDQGTIAAICSQPLYRSLTHSTIHSAH